MIGPLFKSVLTIGTQLSSFLVCTERHIALYCKAADKLLRTTVSLRHNGFQEYIGYSSTSLPFR